VIAAATAAVGAAGTIMLERSHKLGEHAALDHAHTSRDVRLTDDVRCP
jgi:hypothetical protein